MSSPHGLGPHRPGADSATDDIALDHDPLTRVLGELAAEPPEGFDARVIARFVLTPGPLGEVFVAFTDRGISYVRPVDQVDEDADRFAEDFRQRFGRPIERAARPPAGLLPALRDGRAGDLAFDLRGLSEFEEAVLRKALEIPRGEIRPYAWIAREIGRPKAVRATGSALGHNPVPILIPCHRVVRSDGQIGNYALGPAMKHELLSAEDVDLDEASRLASAGVHYLASDTTGVVCYPSCRHARRITPAHRVPFGTMSRAVDAGYRPCRDCRPALAASA
jgi:O-6-methylguanine DNA methyltransferase